MLGMRVGPRALQVALCCVLVIVASPSALSYTLTRAASGQHLRWHVGPNQPLTYTIDNGLGPDLDLGEEYARSVIVAATGTWEGVECDLCNNPDGAACEPVTCNRHALGVKFDKHPKFVPQSAMLGPSCVGPAGEVTGITDDGCPKTGGPWKKQPNGNHVAFLTGDQWTFSQFTIALTLVSANQVSGEIADADILINARDKRFCATDCKANEYDLQSTVTHEFGHMLGLDHSDVAGATMVVQGKAGEEFMRTLASDDIAGVCRAYRMAYDPTGCQPQDEDCAASPSSRGDRSLLWIIAVAALALLGRRFTRARIAGLYSLGPRSVGPRAMGGRRPSSTTE